MTLKIPADTTRSVNIWSTDFTKLLAIITDKTKDIESDLLAQVHYQDEDPSPEKINELQQVIDAMSSVRDDATFLLQSLYQLQTTLRDVSR